MGFKVLNGRSAGGFSTVGYSFTHFRKGKEGNRQLWGKGEKKLEKGFRYLLRPFGMFVIPGKPHKSADEIVNLDPLQYFSLHPTEESEKCPEQPLDRLP
jgi:hypothetical protein